MPKLSLDSNSRRLAAGFALLVTTPVFAASAPPTIQLASSNIIGMDFQDLANIEVTSVSKKEDKLLETAAAVFVITDEDIRRSGATTIPEVLRLAPGIDVARLNSNTWAVSSRGFNSTTANKLLVLIDGRSVYTPLYSGVYWDVQDVQMDSIERIEVIRGPGAAVWGANAVNGVINIILKTPAETQGGRIVAGGGTEERSFGSARYGGALGDKGHYRTWAKYAGRDDSEKVSGGDAGDQWTIGKGGFRADWNGSPKDAYLFSTDVYSGREGETSTITTLTPPFRAAEHGNTLVDGGNAMGRWNRKFSERSNIQFQVYYDRTRRAIPMLFTEERDTYDFDLQNQFNIGSRNLLIWGTGYRASHDQVRDTFAADFDPDAHTMETYNLFFQDEVRVWRSVLFTFGSKVEHNDYTGYEFEPNARASWMINDTNTVWTSVSRAVKTPARLDRNLRFPAAISTTTLTVFSVFGTPDFDSEHLIAYEMGYRAKPAERIFIDVASFYNVYSDLRSVERGAPFVETSPSPTHTVIPFYIGNRLSGESYGLEFVPSAQITPWWRVQGQYTYFHVRLHVDNDSRDTTSVRTEKNDPKNQIGLGTSFNLPRKFEFDAGARYVDNLENLKIASYTTCDARLGWRGIRNVNLEVIGQNLFAPRHIEYRSGTEIERGVFGKATWDF